MDARVKPGHDGFSLTPQPPHRHARLYAGHPRLACSRAEKEDVDGRDKPGHDGESCRLHAMTTDAARTTVVWPTPDRRAVCSFLWKGLQLLLE
jgi:hypothetical protein